MNFITQKLKENNLKVTPQRMAIYKILISTNKHPSAEMIYNELKEDYPAISLATVYKTIFSLKSAGLIQELNVGEGSCRYDADTKFHVHVICTKCNNVFDYIINDVFMGLKNDIEKDLEFELISQQLYFYGKCKNCK